MKKVSIFLLTALMCLGFTITAMASDIDSTSGSGDSHPPYVVDDADLLTSSEESRLNELLADISERQQFTVAVVTTNSTNGKTKAAFTDDYYDYNGYGYGADKDGAMLMISMEHRDWYISTTGYGITALTDAGIDQIGQQLVPYLGNGSYYEAFTAFGQLCEEYVAQAHSGSAYDVGTMPSENTSFGSLAVSLIPISLVIGAVLSLIVCLIMKASLKSVKSQPGAGSYVRQGSLNVDVSRDLFLYTTTTSRPRPKQTSSSGGSSTHTSSSGTSHGGGGGSF